MITFGELTPSKESYLHSWIGNARLDQTRTRLAREALDAYEGWNGKDGVPLKLQELMMVLQIEVSHRYE